MLKNILAYAKQRALIFSILSTEWALCELLVNIYSSNPSKSLYVTLYICLIAIFVSLRWVMKLIDTPRSLAISHVYSMCAGFSLVVLFEYFLYNYNIIQTHRTSVIIHWLFLMSNIVMYTLVFWPNGAGKVVTNRRYRGSLRSRGGHGFGSHNYARDHKNIKGSKTPWGR